MAMPADNGCVRFHNTPKKNADTMPGLRYDVFFDSVRKKFLSEVGLKLHQASDTPMRHAITTENLAPTPPKDQAKPPQTAHKLKHTQY